MMKKSTVLREEKSFSSNVLIGHVTLCCNLKSDTSLYSADSGGRDVQGAGLRSLACWDCRFESLLGRGCLSLVIVCVVR